MQCESVSNNLVPFVTFLLIPKINRWNIIGVLETFPLQEIVDRMHLLKHSRKMVQMQFVMSILYTPQPQLIVASKKPLELTLIDLCYQRNFSHLSQLCLTIFLAFFSARETPSTSPKPWHQQRKHEKIEIIISTSFEKFLVLFLLFFITTEDCLDKRQKTSSTLHHQSRKRKVLIEAMLWKIVNKMYFNGSMV